MQRNRLTASWRTTALAARCGPRRCVLCHSLSLRCAFPCCSSRARFLSMWRVGLICLSFADGQPAGPAADRSGHRERTPSAATSMRGVLINFERVWLEWQDNVAAEEKKGAGSADDGKSSSGAFFLSGCRMMPSAQCPRVHFEPLCLRSPRVCVCVVFAVCSRCAAGARRETRVHLRRAEAGRGGGSGQRGRHTEVCLT